MRASTYFLQQKLAAGDPKNLAAIERVDRSVQRCERIIEELLDLMRGHVDQAVETDIDLWLDELFDDLTAPKGVTVERKLAADGGTCRVDSDLLRRAILKLCDTAWKSVV